MKALLLLSILVVTVAVPALAARDANRRRGLWRMLLFLLLFDAAYLAYVTLGHASLFVPAGR